MTKRVNSTTIGMFISLVAFAFAIVVFNGLLG